MTRRSRRSPCSFELIAGNPNSPAEACVYKDNRTGFMFVKKRYTPYNKAPATSSLLFDPATPNSPLTFDRYLALQLVPSI